MSRYLLMISEHASPLSVQGGVDSGGQNVYVGQIAKELAAKGYEVDILTRRDDPHQPDVVGWTDGVRIINVPAGPPSFLPKEELLPHMAAFTRFALAFCRRRAYDLVHANFFMSGMVAQALQRELGLPFAITFHALGRVRRQFQKAADRFPEERLAIEDSIVASADLIIAECPQDREDLLTLYHADPARVRIVPCGFDPAELWPIDKHVARYALGLDPKVPTLLQLGRMVPRKGVDTVLAGFAGLVRSGFDAHLVVVGGEADVPDPLLTPELGRLMALADNLRIADKVLFTGRRRRDTLRLFYSAADIFLTMPWYEPFGITPLEAMACGTPVIGAAVGGIKYTVRDGVTGFLLPPKDPAALAACLQEAYREPARLVAMGAAARAEVHARFTWQKVATALALLFDDLLAEKPAYLPDAPVPWSRLLERAETSAAGNFMNSPI